MSILIDLDCTVRITTEGPAQGLNLHVYTNANDDSFDELSLEVDVDTDYTNSVHPTGINSQIVSLALEVEGYGIIPPSKLTSGISWERDLVSGSKISLVVDGQNSPFGTEIQWKGPPPGVRNITLWAAYIVNGIPRWSKLISGAISDHSSRKINATQRLMTLTILGPEFRHRTKKVDYVLPPGHGKSPQQIIKDILDLMGINQVSISNGTLPLNRPIQIICQEGIREIDKYADSIGKVIYFDREQNVTLISKGFDSSLVESQLFNEFSITNSDVDIEAKGGEVATRIVVTGEYSKIENCGLEVKTNTFELFEFFAPLNALYSQSADVSPLAPTYNLVGFAATPLPDNLKRRVVREQTLDCGTLIQERIRTYEYKNLRTWRYRIDVDGNISAHNFGYFMDQGLPNDDSELYIWPQERFVEVSESVTFQDYSETEGLVFDGEWSNPPRASKIGSRSFFSGYKLLKSALKTASGTTPWEERPFIADKKITGGHDGVADAHLVEEYFGDYLDLMGIGLAANGYLQYDILRNTIRPDGYRTKDINKTYTSRIVPGSAFQYNGGKESKYEDEIVLGTVETNIIDNPENIDKTEENIYAADEKSGKQTIKIVTDYNEVPLNPKTTIDNADGFLPLSEFMPQEGQNLSNQSFEFPLDAPVLLISHVEFEKEISNDTIEYNEQAIAFGVSELREGSALSCVFFCPFNIPLEPGKVVRVYIRRNGLNEKVFIRNVSGSWNGLGSTIITKAQGRIYVI